MRSLTKKLLSLELGAVGSASPVEVQFFHPFSPSNGYAVSQAHDTTHTRLKPSAWFVFSGSRIIPEVGNFPPRSGVSGLTASFEWMWTMAAEPSNECEWIRQIKAGNAGAVERLLEHYGEGLMGYLYSILGRRESAEDAFQETWLKVMQNIRQFHQETSFGPWLFRIARNTAYDQLRRKWRWSFAGSGDEDDSAVEVPDPHNWGDDFLHRETVRKLLAELQPLHREILWLRFFQDLSYEEIAALCQLPLGTVKSRLKRAMNRLAAAYVEGES